MGILIILLVCSTSRLSPGMITALGVRQAQAEASVLERFKEFDDLLGTRPVLAAGEDALATDTSAASPYWGLPILSPQSARLCFRLLFPAPVQPVAWGQ